MSLMYRFKRIRRKFKLGRGTLILFWIIWNQGFHLCSFNNKDRIYSKSQTVRYPTPKYTREEILRFFPGITSMILIKKLFSRATKQNLILKKTDSNQKIAKTINQSKKIKIHPENKQSKSTTKESQVMKKNLFLFKNKNIPGSKSCQVYLLTTQKIKKN